MPRPRILVFLLLLLAVSASGQLDFRDGAYGLNTARVEFESGEYQACLDAATQAARYRLDGREWFELRLRCLDALGQYTDAANQAVATLAAYPDDLELGVLAHTAFVRGGEADKAAELLASINKAAAKRDPKSLESPELVALGRVALLLKTEPKRVLSTFFKPAIRKDAQNLDAVLAAADLALDKADYALAARTLNEAKKTFGEHPQLLVRLGMAFFPSEREKAMEYLDLALAKNPALVDAFTLQAEHAIDSEQYELARERLGKALQINASHPGALALSAAVALLEADPKSAAEHRAKALAVFKSNPFVDYTIGRKIAQKRRFDEATESQRAALALDPDFLPAKAELGQNLLRLGRDEEGWKLLAEVHEADGYDVTAFNMMKLKDNLAAFRTLRTEHFIIRMPPLEADVYGQRAGRLLEEAREDLCGRYGYQLEPFTVVEFFPQQQDFAVRTLGMPGGLGLLGACFGKVITMNSPGSVAAGTSNWESTLWHEFCHTVTLGASRHRIPRWLTEGISVYEEARRNPACGMPMNPVFRERILDTERGVIPLAELSSSLLAFNEPERIQFAYFQSKLFVEFLVENYGFKTIRVLLSDLGKDLAIESTLARHCAAIAKLEPRFKAFAEQRARRLGPKVDWTTPPPESSLRRDPAGVASYLEEHPNNIWALTARCRHLLDQQDWNALQTAATNLVKLYPNHSGADSGHFFLAAAHRNLGDEDAERAALQTLADLSDAPVNTLQRLLEIDLERKAWQPLANNAERFLEVNPLLTTPHWALGQAHEELGKTADAVEAYRTLLHLEPANPADVHFRLAGLLETIAPADARRHVLLALEEAPRFRDAHALLLKLAAPTPASE